MQNDAAVEDPDQANRFSRALASFTRAELVAPVDAIGGFIDLLVDDAVRHGHDAQLDDLEKIKAAGARLAAKVEGLVADDAFTLEAKDNIEAASSRLRHDLRTPIAAILGYAELVGEEVGEGAQDGFAETLQALIGAARRLLDQVDALVATLRERGGASSGATAAAAEARHQAHEAIRAVLIPSAEPQPQVNGRILIVDDDLTNLDLLSRRLAREGHVVESAQSGEAALAWLDSHAVDLILLDLIMPGLTGVDVLRRLRARDETRLVPVIIVSGLDEADGAIRCIEAGADDYLSKPVDAVLLRARINTALERKLLRDREIAIANRLQIERERSESLLRNVLPQTIVDRLRNGATAIADHFASATILFCDIVGFTALSARLSPGDTLDLLNAVFSEFDRLAAAAGVEKIKTIGDAYMVAGGLPEPRPDHAVRVAEVALQLPAVMEAMGRRFGNPLTVRIGMDTGPVVAGIIGTNKFLYDVWGDTVNTASRMEALGVPGRVHVSAAVRAALGDRYAYDALPPMDVKGKGVMHTFLIR